MTFLNNVNITPAYENAGGPKKHMTQIAVRIVLTSIILNLLQQISPTSPATGYIKKVRLAKVTTNRKMVSWRCELSPVSVPLNMKLR